MLAQVIDDCWTCDKCGQRRDIKLMRVERRDHPTMGHDTPFFECLECPTFFRRSMGSAATRRSICLVEKQPA